MPIFLNHGSHPVELTARKSSKQLKCQHIQTQLWPVGSLYEPSSSYVSSFPSYGKHLLVSIRYMYIQKCNWTFSASVQLICEQKLHEVCFETTLIWILSTIPRIFASETYQFEVPVPLIIFILMLIYLSFYEERSGEWTQKELWRLRGLGRLGLSPGAMARNEHNHTNGIKCCLNW